MLRMTAALAYIGVLLLAFAFVLTIPALGLREAIRFVSEAAGIVFLGCGFMWVMLVGVWWIAGASL